MSIQTRGRALLSLEGLVFLSRRFGYCKVTVHSGKQVTVHFCGTERDATYTIDVFLGGKDFKWVPLPVGLRCRVEKQGEGVIVAASFGPSETSQVHEYTVEFDTVGRETAQLTEREIWPIPGTLLETPLTKLAGLQVDPWLHFKARDGLLSALAQLHRETAGIHALAASRIDLLAHQAFVVGTVIDDPSWRYVLADEVGLGKTIEAGAIAHEMLSARPQARVLVLCPGSLSRQWLCEMHMSFGGRGFRLADLHDAQRVDWNGWTRVVCSLKLASGIHAAAIRQHQWDLVIVDEAHHLLWNRTQYEFVKALSSLSGGVLLLSAVPAREREQELLRLLQFIDPEGYAEGSTPAVRFAELYRAQAVIGRRLRILSAMLDDAHRDPQDVLDAAQRLVAAPVVAEDRGLAAWLSANAAAADAGHVVQACRALRDDVAARYRISRRILKNRRSQLLDQALLTSVERSFEVLTYEPAQLEAAAHETLLDLMIDLAGSEAPRLALHTLLRKAAPAWCDPVAACEVANALRHAINSGGPPSTQELDAAAVMDYEEHEQMLASACAMLAPYADRHLIERLYGLVSAWIESAATPPRVVKLFDAVDDLTRQGCDKILVFAGTWGAAEFVLEQLQQRYGKPALAEFRHDLSDDRKESEVTRFRREAACRILVSDESGGEGRNFQFASAVIHFDLPWSVAAVEQRIGRLDRIGRTEPVRSVVVCAQNSMEFSWAQCLATGFEVFSRSISGLEFMLRDTEHAVIERAISLGPAGIEAMIPEVQDTSQRERASDDADALTDFASFNRSRRYSHAADHCADVLLDDIFPRYFRTISVNDAAKRVTDNRDLNLKIWRLKPEDVTQVKLPGIQSAVDGQLQDHHGTFLRKVARERLDLDFFSTGHALFDAVCAVARTNVKGRTFAVHLATDVLPAGVYLLASWGILPGSSAGEGEGQSLDRAARHLYGRRMQVLIDIASGTVVERSTAQRVLEILSSADTAAADLGERVVASMQPFLDGWAVQLGHWVETSREQAASDNSELFAGADSTFDEAINLEIGALEQLGDKDHKQLASALETCRGAVRQPRCELDSLGLVQVDGAAA